MRSGRERTAQRPVLGRCRAFAFAALAVVAVVIALCALRAGAYPLGTAYEDDASCLLPGALPANVAVAQEGHIPASAERTWFPLGVICTIHPLGRGRGTLVMPHQDWPATWTSLGSFAAAAVLMLAAAVSPRIRVRFGRASRAPA